MLSTLIEVFTYWGMPQNIQVDNCLPFVVPARDTPTPLLLWLVGMGIEVHRIRPYRPTDNAVVERMQGVTYRWAEPFNCQTVEQLNTNLEQACLINREQYPCSRLNGKTRAASYPKLLEGGRPFDPHGFELQRVLDFLAKGVWVRKTGKRGVMSFCSQLWNLTVKYKYRHVYVHLDPKANEWVISLDKAVEIKRIKNTIITEKKILNLDIQPKNRNQI